MNRFGWVLAGAVTVGVVSLLLVALRSEVHAQQQPVPRGSDHLSVLSIDTEMGGNVVVVDRQRQVMLVYKVDDSKASISLRSVRNIRWDLMLDEFNTAAPKPKDVREMVEQR